MVFKTTDPEQATARLDGTTGYCQVPEAVPELHWLAATLKRWRTEAANAKIKDVECSGRGFRNFANHYSESCLPPDESPDKLNSLQESEPDVPASLRRACYGRVPCGASDVSLLSCRVRCTVAKYQ